MNILILDSGLKETLIPIIGELNTKQHEVTIIDLKEQQIKDCIGCYDCWLKTPGICCIQDDMPKILQAYVKADVVVLASPVKMGFITAELKSMIDRLIPLNHPYLRLNDDRMGHVRRYEKMPKRLMLLDDAQNSKFIKRIFAPLFEQANHLLYTSDKREVIIREITID